MSMCSLSEHPMRQEVKGDSMVVRGRPLPNPTATRCIAAAEKDADQLWAAIVALRGKAAAEASLAGQAHLAAVKARGEA